MRITFKFPAYARLPHCPLKLTLGLVSHVTGYPVEEAFRFAPWDRLEDDRR
jgi:hypothetical protein